ncbi:MAG: branched-chain amino acid ABC transporter permease [Hyphomicrobiales bacterium]|nr:branched-chain amino acid ABC transporter permease [Gammaproteobacteria bacterium]MCP4071141.1 branched-chain amino acid ABC transporter permease [Hyphomicrobiales bacterium]
MAEFIQYLVAVLNLGAIYALLALGLVVVFGQLGFLNFAHGDLMTLFGYALFFMIGWHTPFWLAVLLAIIFAGLCAVAMERIAFRPLRGRSPMTLLITSFAISGALHVIFQVGISPRSKPIPIPEFLSGYITIGDVFVSRAQIFTVVVAFASLILLRLFLAHSRLGISLRASAADFDVARVVGIQANRVIALAFFLSGALAGVAALLWISQRGAVFPALGLTPMIKALIAAIIGGLANPKGALYGGFLLGALEATLLFLLPDNLVVFRDAAVLLLLIIFLVFRPNGIIASNPEPMR